MNGRIPFSTLVQTMGAVRGDDGFWSVTRHGEDFDRTLNALRKQYEVGAIAINPVEGLIAFRAKASIHVVSPADAHIAATLDDEKTFCESVGSRMDAIIGGIK